MSLFKPVENYLLGNRTLSLSHAHTHTHTSPGMPEMLSPGAALVGAGLGKDVALVTDGRFSGASHGMQQSLQ